MSAQGIQNNLRLILVQVANEARFTGSRITGDEQKILNDLRDLIEDFPNIILVMAEKLNIDTSSIGPENFTVILDESFQFILSHMYDTAKIDGNVSKDQALLLEKIAERLDQTLNAFIG
jgi:hypothetical protein